MKSASTGLRAAFRSPRSGEAVHGPKGFTLLETLTALTILAIALVSLFETYAFGLRASVHAERTAGARILAQSLLTETLTGIENAQALHEGQTGSYRWRVTIEPAEEGSHRAGPGKPSWRLHRVTVSVGWEGGRNVQLATLKLRRAND